MARIKNNPKSDKHEIIDKKIWYDFFVNNESQSHINKLIINDEIPQNTK